MLTSTKRILPIALVAALLGGSVGAFVMRSPKTSEPANITAASSPLETQANAANQSESAEQTAYRNGYEEGFLAAGQQATTQSNYRTDVRNNSTTQRQAYNHVTRQPQKRSFWQKHRDKLTLAMGTGGGAVLGGLLGGKKGAVIGAAAGAGGSALYTYKIRKRNRQN